MPGPRRTPSIELMDGAGAEHATSSGRLSTMEISLSTTGFNDAARCLKRYEYRWIDRLVLKPKDVRPAMRRGTWIHRALQLADEGQPWRTELDRMWAWAIENEVDPEAASLLRVETGELVDDYLAYWAGHEDP